MARRAKRALVAEFLILNLDPRHQPLLPSTCNEERIKMEMEHNAVVIRLVRGGFAV